MLAEAQVAKYLDLYFYPTITESHFRCNDVGDQLRGRDCEIVCDNKKFIVDEKTSFYYINKDIPTFSLELGFKTSRGEYVDGWFVDQSLDTTHYLLIWPFSYDEKKKGWEISCSDISKLRCMLIEKISILNYLQSKSFSVDDLKNKRDEIRLDDIDGPIEKSGLSDFYFFYTKRLSEQSINLIVRRPLLEELSTGHWMVNSESVIMIK